MKCYICDDDMKYNPKMTVVFHVENAEITIRNVPGYECESCHEQLFNKEVTENLLNFIKKGLIKQ